jgi:hypothetical protein
MAKALLEEPTLEGGMERMLREAATAYTRRDLPRGCLVVSAAVNCSSPEVQHAGTFHWDHCMPSSAQSIAAHAPTWAA